MKLIIGLMVFVGVHFTQPHIVQPMSGLSRPSLPLQDANYNVQPAVGIDLQNAGE